MNQVQHNYLARPQPFRTEGPQGYKLRLAEENGVKPNDLQGFVFEKDFLVSEGLLPKFEVYPELHHHVDRVRQSHHKGGSIWNRRYPRFCPHCLKEDTYWRLGWELIFFDACPEHGNWLIDQCSSCHGHLSWDRYHLSECQCGSDLRQEETRSAPDAVIGLATIILEKFQGKTECIAPLTSLCSFDTYRLVRYLGACLNISADLKPLKIYQAADMKVSWDITSLASEIIMNWPNAFHHSLKKIQQNFPQGVTKTLPAVFGRAYAYLYHDLNIEAFNPIRLEFEKFIQGSWRGRISRTNTRLSEEILKNAEWISAEAARNALGVSQQRLKRLIKEGLLVGETQISTSGDEFIRVRKDHLEFARANIESNITMKDASELLGLTKRRMRKVLSILFPDIRKSGGPTTVWAIPRVELERLLSLSDGLPAVDLIDEDLILLKDILKFWAWNNNEVATMINAVADGKIRIQKIHQYSKGISAWILNKRELKLWHERTKQGAETMLNIQQFAKVLGVRNELAYEIIQANLVEFLKFPGAQKRGVHIHRDQIAKFREKYILGTEIAEQLRTSPRSVKGLLAEFGVYPVTHKEVGKFRQAFFLRDKFLRFALEELLNDGVQFTTY